MMVNVVDPHRLRFAFGRLKYPIVPGIELAHGEVSLSFVIALFLIDTI